MTEPWAKMASSLSLYLETSTHVEKAVSAIRDSGAFPPLPADFDKPRMELRFMFMYNLSRNPPSCRE
jgi:hypothetical protein